MKLAPTLLASLAFVLAGFLCIGVAVIAANVIEDRSSEAVQFAMREEGLDWVEVSANGLQVTLRGTAPDESERFRALSKVGTVVDAGRVIDALDVVDPQGIQPPTFSLEMLRNGDGISLIGLIPDATGRDRIVDGISSVTSGVEVTNMVETADYPVPEGWDAALEFGLAALRELPRSQISVYEGRVEVTAVSDSLEQRTAFTEVLNDAMPAGLFVELDISAPRPVITPFTLRFVRDENGGRFEACSAETEASRSRILRAANAAGLTGPEECEIGIGVPSPQWSQAVSIAIGKLAELGRGSVTFSDADVTLIAAQDTPQALFDQVAGELDAELPDVFSLHSVLPEPSGGGSEGPPSFSATRSPEGYVQLRGRLPNDEVEAAVLSFSRALFGRNDTYLATRIDPDLPEGWPLRVLAGIEGLSHLNNGSLVVQPDRVVLRGVSGSETAVSDLTRLLSEKLGEAEDFEINVTYEEILDPDADQLSPEECVARINAILAEQKITFDPGSVEINEASGLVLDRLAEILPDCREARMEIGGHTDSQGGEDMNLNLSQARADAVLNGLLAREVLVSNLTAQGYGETQPIADNETEEGRETNRRIEFRLLAGGTETTEEPVAEADATAPDDDAPADDTEGDDSEQN